MRGVLRKVRAVVLRGRRATLDSDACKRLCGCGGASPCEKVYYRYDPCPYDPDFHAECPTSRTLGSVYMRCDVRCPAGCGVEAGHTSPRGIKHREWCHSIATDQETGRALRFYDPADFPPPKTPPPQAVPLPADAELVDAPAQCLETTSTNNRRVCWEPCCKCWRYYCGDPCPCSGRQSPKQCVRGTQDFHDARRDNHCLAGGCAEFNDPIGYDELPDGAEQTTYGPGTCCDRPGCDGLCDDCARNRGALYYTIATQCDGHADEGRYDYDCCCSLDDSIAELTLETVRRFAGAQCPTDEVLSVARGRLTLPVRDGCGTMTVTQTITRRRPDGSLFNESFDYQVQVCVSCSPASAIPYLKNAADFINQPLPLATLRSWLSADCQSAVLTSRMIVSCLYPDGSPSVCHGSTIDTIVGCTIFDGVRSAACRAGCQERTFRGRRIRRTPLPLELLS